MKIAIVFDFDETIGFFSQLGFLTDFIELHYKIKITKNLLFDLLDIYHECFRPNIFKIFNYLKTQNNVKIYIYTNNNGGKSWVNNIRKYIEHKINAKLFKKTICAWMVDGVVCEKKRTTYEKTYDDFINCTGIKKHKVLFIDDYLHDKMKHDNVKYILIDKFQYIYDKETMLNKFHKTQLSKKIDKEYFDHLFTNYYTDPFMNSLTSTYNNQFLLRSIKSFIKENNSQEQQKVQKSRKKKQ